MDITWNHVALSAQQLKQAGISHGSSVAMVSSNDSTQIENVARFALQSLGSSLVEVGLPNISNEKNVDKHKDLLASVLAASDFVVDCTGGKVSDLLKNYSPDATKIQILVHNELEWVPSSSP